MSKFRRLKNSVITVPWWINSLLASLPDYRVGRGNVVMILYTRGCLLGYGELHFGK